MSSELPSITSCSYSAGDQSYYTDNTTRERRISSTMDYDPFNTQGLWTKRTDHGLINNPCSETILDKLDTCNLGDEEVSERRLVKVMIVDPDLSIPVENAVLVNEPEQITDLDDQELFFELDIKNILSTHNEYRKTVLDKTNKEKEVYLEPVRIKDLKMVVLNIANF